MSQCGISGASTQIVNGDNAPECKWRWQVSLQDNIGHFCGGMLIRPDWVVTAAHCLSNDDIIVKAGEWRLSTSSNNEQSVTVRAGSRQIMHPKYTRNKAYDIALLKLPRPLQMTRCVGTVCLPTRDVSGGTRCSISGWGMLSSGGRLSNILQEAEVTTLSNRDCQNTGYSSSRITPDMLCAQGRARNGSITDACQGDSGGPLVCQGSSGTWTLHGATSWGNGCAERNYPGVWSRVFFSLGWIESHIGSSSPSPTPSPPPSQPSPSPTGRFVEMPIVRSMLDSSGFMPSCERWNRKYRTITSASQCKSALCSLGFQCKTPPAADSPRNRPYGCMVKPSGSVHLNLDDRAKGQGSKRDGPVALCAER